MKAVTLLAVALGIATAAAFALLPQLGASASSVPFTDPNAQGTITLCDSSGTALTHGSIYGKPFAWRAVGSQQAPKGYTIAGRTATLQAFQPIDQVDPLNWNGDYLTASARYTNTSKPMAAASGADRTLADWLAAYPTKWDGLVQLRMFVGAPGVATYTTTYDSAVLQVSGENWTMLQGGTSGCNSGTAITSEMILPSISALPTPKPGAISRPAPPHPIKGISGSPTLLPSSSPTSVPAGSTAAVPSGSASSAVASQHSSSSSSSGILIAIIAAAAVALAAFATLAWRRRANP
jgi:hypothetical protein